jgi:hypothetical protein
MRQQPWVTHRILLYRITWITNFKCMPPTNYSRWIWPYETFKEISQVNYSPEEPNINQEDEWCNQSNCWICQSISMSHTFIIITGIVYILVLYEAKKYVCPLMWQFKNKTIYVIPNSYMYCMNMTSLGKLGHTYISVLSLTKLNCYFYHYRIKMYTEMF